MLGFPLPILMSLGAEPVMSMTVDPSTTCNQRHNMWVNAAIVQAATCTANRVGPLLGKSLG